MFIHQFNHPVTDMIVRDLRRMRDYRVGRRAELFGVVKESGKLIEIRLVSGDRVPGVPFFELNIPDKTLCKHKNYLNIRKLNVQIVFVF
jgi:hypothetical protein